MITGKVGVKKDSEMPVMTYIFYGSGAEMEY